MTIYFTPRESQAAILQYQGGTLGISAVPGSGKTQVLSALAAKIISSKILGMSQEVLIVTLVNSAVDNFSQRISGFIKNEGLIPHLGYRVRTLHGLAHDIVRENPSIVGLDNRFAIIDEREADFIRKEAVNAWLDSHPFDIDDLLDPSLEEGKRDYIRRQNLPEVINSMANAFIRTAKDQEQTPESLRTRLDSTPVPLKLAEIGWDIYANYQRALNYRGAVDFDDLIRLALSALNISPELLSRLQDRFPYILEDEAQDSSALQEQILGKLNSGNWVRVGDPNQAIFETFTTAKPEYLLNFISRAKYKRDLPVSGRSQPAIINLANQLTGWVMHEHPIEECRSALTIPLIHPTLPDDPQPNPPINMTSVHLIQTKYSPDEEVEAVVKSIEKWLPTHLDQTIAVLTPTNRRGVSIINKLKERKIDCLEYLSSTASTRAAAGALGNLVQYLADPASSSKLSRVYQVWRRNWRDEDSHKSFYNQISELLRKCSETEIYLAPTSENDWLDAIKDDLTLDALNELQSFRQYVRRWHSATLLPIDQLILTLSQDLFTEPADLALSQKIALVLHQVARDHSDWRLPELSNELGVIAKNERKFLGFSNEDGGFDPNLHRGRVVVSTMHKAKGLEWDRVYLLSINNYDFPSGMENDRYISEKWYIRGGLNIEAEALGQLRNALTTDEFSWQEEGEATFQARVDYIRERLRLFFVAITRAKKDLVITWNTGTTGSQTQALPFAALTIEPVP